MKISVLTRGVGVCILNGSFFDITFELLVRLPWNSVNIVSQQLASSYMSLIGKGFVKIGANIDTSRVLSLGRTTRRSSCQGVKIHKAVFSVWYRTAPPYYFGQLNWLIMSPIKTLMSKAMPQTTNITFHRPRSCPSPLLKAYHNPGYDSVKFYCRVHTITPCRRRPGQVSGLLMIHG